MQKDWQLDIVICIKIETCELETSGVSTEFVQVIGAEYWLAQDLEKNDMHNVTWTLDTSMQ